MLNHSSSKLRNKIKEKSRASFRKFGRLHPLFNLSGFIRSFNYSLTIKLMREQYMREEFLKAYDECADDIFEYCYEQTAEREVAKYLTRNVFVDVWDTLVYYGIDSIRNLNSLIHRTAKDHIRNFAAGKRNKMAYYDNLWNLTLSQ
jgi:hypothetical protein